MDRLVLKHLIGRKPFRSFEVGLSSGQTFPVKHPEVAILGEFVVAVLERLDDDSRNEPRMVWIDYRHIVHCRPLTNWQAPF
jgi:hypothetical protein